MQSNSQPDHRDFLLRALELASSRRGYCAPNPAVGAVLVQDGQIIGEGVHWACGEPHAEVVALRGQTPGRKWAALCKGRGQISPVDSFPQGPDYSGGKDLTLYISLEPCAHQGRTPPCTEAILAAGISKVIYAYQDPNPIVAGKGHKQLEAAGVEVMALQVPEIEEFYQAYRYWTQNKKPWVRAKLAMSLDGKIAGPQGERVQITGPVFKEHTYRCRRAADALLTTAKTIQQDDPFLDVRLENTIENKRLYILDRELSLGQHYKIWRNSQPICVFYSAQNNGKLASMPIREGIRAVAVPEKEGQLDLEAVMSAIGADGVHDLWVEAGGVLLSSLLEHDCVQELQLATALQWLGSSAQSAFQDKPLNFNGFSFKRFCQLGEDWLCLMRKQPISPSLEIIQSNQEVNLCSVD